MERKTKIIFVCHGNICRSPMAEFIFKCLINELGLLDKFDISSRALSYEEIGNDIYPPIKRVLIKNNIPFSKHKASKLTLDEVNNADEVILMDSYNEMRFKNEFPHAKNAKKLLFYSNSNADVSDPWYSERYDECFEIIYYGIKNYIKYLLNTK